MSGIGRRTSIATLFSFRKIRRRNWVLRPGSGIDVEAVDFGRFSWLLPRLAREHDISLLEVSATDESLESVFSYLIAS